MPSLVIFISPAPETSLAIQMIQNHATYHKRITYLKLCQSINVSFVQKLCSKKQIHMPNKEKWPHRKATFARCQRLFSPVSHFLIRRIKRRNTTSFHGHVFHGWTSSQYRVKGFRDTQGVNANSRRDLAAGRSSRHVNARIRTSSWFPWVPSWSSSRPESLSRRRCSPPKPAPPGRTRPLDSTN